MNERHVLKSCLYSTVQNTSGGQKIFGFLPPHSVQLDADEEYTVFGDIRQCLTTRRDQQAFAAAIDRGDLAIISTPAPIIVDFVSGLSKMLHVASGVITVTAPCFDVSDSLDVTIPAGAAVLG